MRRVIQLLFCYLLIGQTLAYSFDDPDVTFQKEHIGFVTPSLINPKYFSFELGYLIKKSFKSINYHYNAYALAFMAEESYAVDSNLRAGQLGGKGGVILPTQPWIPLSLFAGFGYAKAALHDDPWFGKREKSVSKKDMFLLEGGAIYNFNGKFIFRYTYQLNNVKFFIKKSLFSFGINF